MPNTTVLRVVLRVRCKNDVHMSYTTVLPLSLYVRIVTVVLEYSLYSILSPYAYLYLYKYLYLVLRVDLLRIITFVCVVTTNPMKPHLFGSSCCTRPITGRYNRRLHTKKKVWPSFPFAMRRPRFLAASLPPQALRRN